MFVRVVIKGDQIAKEFMEFQHFSFSIAAIYFISTRFKRSPRPSKMPASPMPIAAAKPRVCVFYSLLVCALVWNAAGSVACLLYNIRMAIYHVLLLSEAFFIR